MFLRDIVYPPDGQDPRYDSDGPAPYHPPSSPGRQRQVHTGRVCAGWYSAVLKKTTTTTINEVILKTRVWNDTSTTLESQGVSALVKPNIDRCGQRVHFLVFTLFRSFSSRLLLKCRLSKLELVSFSFDWLRRRLDFFWTNHRAK